MNPELLRPSQNHLIIDLVRDAGIDVSDWANYGDGRKPPAANPRYCYEWAFVQYPNVIVLNIWFPDIKPRDDTLVLAGNMKRIAETSGEAAVRRKRAASFDRAVRLAWTDEISLRLVVCAGRRRKPGVDSEASRVRARLLDSVAWHVRQYNDRTGAFVLARGPLEHRVVDQFDLGDTEQAVAETRSVSGTVYIRSAEVRREVLKRAGGYCEWCGQPGFALPDGNTYLETHHVVPLSEDGLDNAQNVAALCANHHREAHYGSSREGLREQLLRYTAKRGLRIR